MAAARLPRMFGLFKFRELGLMECRLGPIKGAQYLEPDEVVARLRNEFVHVDADRDIGYDHIGKVVAGLVRCQAPQEVIDQSLAIQNRTIWIVAADDPSSDSYLGFFVKPDSAIVCCLHVGQNPDAVRPLVQRCAMALGYRDLDDS